MINVTISKLHINLNAYKWDRRDVNIVRNVITSFTLLIAEVIITYEIFIE